MLFLACILGARKYSCLQIGHIIISSGFLLNKGDVTQDDSQRQLLVQHSVRVAMLENVVTIRNNVAAILKLCFAYNRRCESSRVISP